MAVAGKSLEEHELVHHLRDRLNDPWEIHHFRQPEEPFVGKQREEIGSSKARSRGLQRRCRDAAREVEIDLEREITRRFQKIADALQTQDVGNFVRVCDHGGRPPGQDGRTKL